MTMTYEISILARKKATMLLMLAVLFCAPLKSFAQLIITADSNAASLANTLAAPGVVISNAYLSAQYPYTGRFTCPHCNLGLSYGITLATDSAVAGQGPNNLPNAPIHSAPLWPCDTDLTDLAGISRTFCTSGYALNASILEFDVIPMGDTVHFKFVFASEEYPQFTCRQFNDIFAFFANGPNPSGGNYYKHNFALTPVTNLPISINTINAGHPYRPAYTNCTPQGLADSMYYVDNGYAYYPVTSSVMPAYQFDPYYIQYNGFTLPIDAILPVVPCQSYHLKIAIQDMGGPGGTSAVFIQGGSLSSNKQLYIDTVAYDYGSTSAVPNCVSGKFGIKLLPAQSQSYIVRFNLGGNAINGTDYTLVPDSIIIPAGDTLGYITINPTSNVSRFVRLYLLNSQCGLGSVIDSADLYISSREFVVSSDTVQCLSDSIQLYAYGYDSYQWSPSAGLSSTTISNPICTIAGAYYVTATLGSCTVLDSVIVSDHFSMHHTIDTGFCMGQLSLVSLIPDVLFGLALPVTYVDNGQAVQQTSNVAAGLHYAVATNGRGCIAYDTISIPIIIPLISDTVFTRSPRCQGDSDGVIAMRSNGGYPPYVYHWQQLPAIYDGLDSMLKAGIYTIIVADIKGCADTMLITIADGSCQHSDTVQVPVPENRSLYVPNAFTPNGDGINDVFMVYGKDIRFFELKIFNRWGEKVYESNDAGKGWDGTFSGTPQPTGIYSYLLNISYGTENGNALKGSITLIR